MLARPSQGYEGVLPPDADKNAIDEQRKRLVAQLIPALKHYVAAAAKDAPVVFSGWPAKRPRSSSLTTMKASPALENRTATRLNSA